MKKIITTSILLLVTMVTFGQEYTINTSSSKMEWTGKAAFNSYSLTGNINVKSGKILIENDSIKQLHVVIDMKSLNHKNKDLEKHLKNKDFFQVKKYKEAIFKLEKPVSIKNNKAIIKGLMTIKNKSFTEEVTLEVIQGTNVKINFNTILDRTKYGVTYNSPNFFKKMKENAIADEFTLKSELIFN